MRALVGGLADTMPPAAVPRVADLLAPLLHSAGWRPQLHAWLSAALAALPVIDGVPEPYSCEALLVALTTAPDALAGGGGDARDGVFLPPSINMDAVERVRVATCEFARSCRRMQSASEFEVAAYNWKKM